MSTETSSEYLPARMLNQFVYCPRLFWYEHVEGVFVHNRETVEGEIRHARVDGGTGELVPAAEIAPEDVLHARSVMLSSDGPGLIAKMDLIEVADGSVTPVDYKRGKPLVRADGTIDAWDSDRAQLIAQGVVLRDNGYICTEAVLYYCATKQRVRIAIDEDAIEWVMGKVREVRSVATGNGPPAPLVDSPKCPRCSLVGICLPDETYSIALMDAQRHPLQGTFPQELPQVVIKSAADEPESSTRKLLPARDDLRPLYLNTPGVRVGKSGNVVKVLEKDRVVEEVRVNGLSQVNLFGNIQITTQVIQMLCDNEIPIAYFSMAGWFYGLTQGLGPKNAMLRRDQFRRADSPSFCLQLARELVAGKIRNQRTLLQRNHIEPSVLMLGNLKRATEEAGRAESLPELLGIEGNAARIYFGHFGGMIKSADEPWSETEGKPLLSFDFKTRNRRPPRDPVNALLSLAYSLLAKDLTIVCQAVGFDPFLGFYHQPRFGRAPLALDLMEPFRTLIADSAVLTAINTQMVRPGDFVQAGDSVALKPSGRKSFFKAYEQRMDTLVTHPIFGYRVSYRRMLEIQTRLLARVVVGELSTYPVFTTR